MIAEFEWAWSEEEDAPVFGFERADMQWYYGRLQEEVKKEPATALLGGEDGLLFYRVIAEKWVPLLKPGGVLAVEIGEEQAEPVGALFERAGLCQVEVHRDFQELDRVITAKKRT